MSIYCSLFGVGNSDRHKRKCRYDILGDDPCICGECPIVYQGSNVLPANTDMRHGEIGISGIPPHISRSRRERKGDTWHPWLRFHLCVGKKNASRDTVILSKKQVANLRDALTNWLESTEQASEGRKEGE